MTAIIDGKLELSELTQNSKGGTELMAQRMVRDIPKKLLEPFHIIFSRPEKIRKDKPTILLCHDLSNDPQVSQLADHSYREHFAKFVFVSDWQMQMFNLQLGVPYKESTVVPNAVEHYRSEYNFVEKWKNLFDNEDEPVRLIYHTTPHRGLELLVPVIDAINNQTNHKVVLDVYSSFGIYGWNDRDAPYEHLFERIKESPCMNYHGAIPYDECRSALEKAHVFGYPNIWPETSCLAMIENLMAGNMAVCPNYAALPETCAKWATMYNFHEDRNEHAKIFGNVLIGTLDRIQELRSNPEAQRMFFSYLDNQVSYYNAFYSWENRKDTWINLFKSWSDQIGQDEIQTDGL